MYLCVDQIAKPDATADKYGAHQNRLSCRGQLRPKFGPVIFFIIVRHKSILPKATNLGTDLHATRAQTRQNIVKASLADEID